MLDGDKIDAALLPARKEDDEVVGFAEVRVRRDPVNGRVEGPAVFLGGVYVVPEHRQNGCARLLRDAAES